MSLALSSAQRSPWYKPTQEEKAHDLAAFLEPFIQTSDLFADRGEDWLAEAEDLGLIPAVIGEHLQMCAFLSQTVLAAQHAQRQWGTPASVLIGIALGISAWNAKRLPNGNAWFFAEARKLATDERFRPATELVHDVRLYLQKLEELGYCAEIDVDAEDALSPIERFGLTECDVAGILPVGEFRKSRYHAVADETGRMELKSALDLREFRAMALCRSL